MGTLLVSDEIVDRIDEKQFGEENEITNNNIDEHIIIKLESEDILIPGIIEKYMWREKEATNEEEIMFVFITQTKNVSKFQINMDKFNNAKLSLGTEKIGEYNLQGMTVRKVQIEQVPTKAGCVITVIYR